MSGIGGVVFLVAMVAMIYHHRITLVTYFIPKVYEPCSKENLEGAEFQSISWANYLQTSGSVGASCCLPKDPQILYDNFCDNKPLSIVDHAIPMLSACTFYVRGRQEHPMESFVEHGYEGLIKHRGYGHYLVKTWGKQSNEDCEDNDSEVCKMERSVGPVQSQVFACSLLKSCAKDKSKSACKQLDTIMGGC